MAYVKNTWVDQSVERPKTYEMTNNADGSVTLIDSFGLVSELGTPVNADNMNHIEEGIEACDLHKYSSTETFSKGEWVTGIINNEKGIYESLIDNNTGNPLTDVTKWERVNLGGAGAPIGSLFPTFCAADFTPNNCLPCNGSEYSSSQFPSFYTNYLIGARLLTCTYEEFAASVSTYGKCAKFAVDATVGTFKTPYLPDGSFIQQAMSAEELGKSYKAGLPSVTHTHTATTSSNGAHTHSLTLGKFAGNAMVNDSGWGADNGNGGNVKRTTTSNGAHTHTITVNKNSSVNTVYGNSTTVQPESVALRWFVVVGTGSMNEADMDWSAWATSLNGRASNDLTNLTPAGEKHFINKSQITNCILEAPEKIKIVYEGSDIVIKAGTIAIVPSGFEEDGTTQKFEEYTLEKDLTIANDMSQSYFMGLNFLETGTNTWRRFSSGCYTGPTAPASPVIYDIWYDTSANIIRRHDGTQWYVQKHSLPIASIDGPKYSLTSVFNAIGGFGTTFFVPKGVKFLMPNGKNQDGTLNNIEYTTDKVLLQINTAVSSYNLEYALLIDNQGGVSYAFTSRCYISPIKPIINPKSGNEYWYNPTTNIITDFNFNVPSPRIACIIPFVASIKNSKIFSIQPVEPVSVLGRENKHEILNWNAPSPVYEDLTLGASGSKYYMPANGYLQAACTGTMGSTFFELTSPEISATASYNGGWGRCSIPVRAEQEITVFYGGTNFTSRLFRFTYAEGER